MGTRLHIVGAAVPDCTYSRDYTVGYIVRARLYMMGATLYTVGTSDYA